MSVRDSRSAGLARVVGLALLVLAATIGYVFVYGGDAATPVRVLVGAVGVGLSLFSLYLFYRFVIAVETIAEKL
jgi:uncharacterized RDD family membrane protein YckC